MKAERDCVPVIFVLFTTMLFTLTACNASPEKSAQVVEPNSISESEQVNATPEQANATPGQGQTDVVRFTDPVLETIVRASIGKQSGAITMDDVKTVTRLDLSNAYQRYISDETVIHDINGLECFTSLETLDLSSHQISDITPLKGLHGLRQLIS
jgi:Leucine-rich repeat (LRR) protein